MKTPPSLHFTHVELTHHFNARRNELIDTLRVKDRNKDWSNSLRGTQACRGIPFVFGEDDGPDVLLLRPGDDPVVNDLFSIVRCEKLSCEGRLSLRVNESCWIAIRVRGSVAGRDADVAAHTSAVHIEVVGKPIFATADAVAVLAQIEGSIAYVDTLAPRSDEAHHSRVRAALD